MVKANHVLESLRMQRSSLLERYEQDRTKRLISQAAKATVDRRVDAGTANQQRLWNQVHTLNNKISVLEEDMYRVRNPKQLKARLACG